jgi:hypothetical protein
MTMKFNVVVELDRAVTMVRPEKGTITLTIVPTETFAALDEVEKQEWLKALEEEKRFGHDRNGELSFFSEGLDQLFTITKESETWEYSGGECDILDTRYESWAMRKCTTTTTTDYDDE